MGAVPETMFYEGKVPWHKVGKNVQGALNAAEAITAAGLDWVVDLEPVFLPDSTGKYNELPYNAVIRQTDKTVYQVAHRTWSPLQNAEAFAFFDKVVGEGKAIYHTAGSLKNGSRIWILAKLPDIAIATDQTERYILLVNAHDGSIAAAMFRTAVRVVCWNTLQMALDSKNNVQRFYARHTKNIGDRAYEARDILGLSEIWFSEFKERAERMAQLALPAPDMKNYVKFVLDIPEKKEIEELYRPTQYAYAKIMELHESGKGQKKIRGTQWGAYNAVTNFVDHYREPRGKSKDARLAAVWFGSGAILRNRAWSYLEAIPK